MVVGWCRSLVAEHWRLKPEALGSIPGGTTFLSFPLPFQRSSDSNGLDDLYRSSDLGEPLLSDSQCCDDAQDSFVIANTRSNYHLISTIIVCKCACMHVLCSRVCMYTHTYICVSIYIPTYIQ